MKQVIYILILSSLFLHASCKKKSTIKVKTENIVTGEPIGGVTIFLTEQLSSGLFNNERGTFFEGVTNENGVLFIEYEQKNNGKYTIIHNGIPNQCYHNSKSFPLVTGSKSEDITFQFAPCAFLKLKIENVNCQGGDNFKLYYMGRQVPGHEFQEGTLMSEHDGCVDLESTSHSNVPMGERYYKWEVTRGGVTEVFQDTIYLNEGEYRTYEILY